MLAGDRPAEPHRVSHDLVERLERRRRRRGVRSIEDDRRMQVAVTCMPEGADHETVSLARPADPIEHLRDRWGRHRNVVEERRSLALQGRQRHPPRAEQEAPFLDIIRAQDALRGVAMADLLAPSDRGRRVASVALDEHERRRRRIEVHPRHLVDRAHGHLIHDLEERQVGARVHRDDRPCSVV